MQELQLLLAVVHFGAEQETAAWASGRFELTACAFPRQAAAARRITPETARAALAAKYRELVPCRAGDAHSANVWLADAQAQFRPPERANTRSERAPEAPIASCLPRLVSLYWRTLRSPRGVR
jgi:hypothetical protein